MPLRPARPPGWVAPGPQPAAPPGVEPGPHEDLSFLSGDWRIFQRRDGHRWSLDDLATAWFAVQTVRDDPPTRALDLGCGIGSVLQLVAWSFPEARVTGVEAQPVSVSLARRSLRYNGADDRCVVLQADFREPGATPRPGTYELVTGTPPYIPLGRGTVSERVQRGAACFETRGGVEAYCAAAARALRPGGWFVTCAGGGAQRRVFDAAAHEGLRVDRWREVIPRAGKAPLFGLFALQRPTSSGDASPAEVPEPRAPLVVRDARGARTRECLLMREEMGLPPTPARAAPHAAAVPA